MPSGVKRGTLASVSLAQMRQKTPGDLGATVWRQLAELYVGIGVVSRR